MLTSERRLVRDDDDLLVMDDRDGNPWSTRGDREGAAGCRAWSVSFDISNYPTYSCLSAMLERRYQDMCKVE